MRETPTAGEITREDAIAQSNAYCARVLHIHGENPPDAAFQRWVTDYWRPRFAAQSGVSERLKAEEEKRQRRANRIKAQIRMDERRRIENHSMEAAKYTQQYMRTLLSEIADEHGFTPDEIKAKVRARKWAKPRQIFCYRAAIEGGLSTPTIGKFLGRDHSTVMYSIDRERKVRKVV